MKHYYEAAQDRIHKPHQDRSQQQIQPILWRKYLSYSIETRNTNHTDAPMGRACMTGKVTRSSG